VPKQLRIRSYRMNLPPLRTLFFEDLSIGMTETLEKTVSSSDVVGFAQLTGDRNPIHLSEHFAARTSFGKRIAHGLYTASLISAVLGTLGCRAPARFTFRRPSISARR
jgi:3-hydroxybutyryl-CoA dehydratase